MLISIFKTTVTKDSEIEMLAPHLRRIGNWNFDLEDCDHILRVESSANVNTVVIETLNKNGFQCEEL